MMYQLWRCSEEALKKCPDGFDINTADMTPMTDKSDNYQRRIYPFHRMQVGHSFAVDYVGYSEEPNYTKLKRKEQEGKLRSAVSYANRYCKFKKRFVLIKHDDVNRFEVARIA